MAHLQETRAVLFEAANRVAIRDVPLPPLRENELLIENEYSAISVGTERWCLLGELHPPGEAPTPFPFVPGYQAAGVVLEVGPAVQGFVRGDRVFSVNGRLDPSGPHSCWGGHMHYHVAQPESVLKLPADVSTREASYLVLAQVGFNGATQPPVGPNDTVVVIGDGLVGQWAAQVFRHRGAHVLLAGHHDDRLALAARWSADEVVNTHHEDLAALVRRRWPQGVQIAAESASRSMLIRQAIHLLEYHGKLVLLGYYPEGECLLDIHWVRERETTVYCPNSWARPRLKGTLDLVGRGRMHVEELITHELPAERAADAYRLIVQKSEPFLGIVLRWN
mgnify:CR=1 FL=1